MTTVGERTPLRVDLPAWQTSPGLARTYVRERARRLGLGRVAVENAELIASELVTNAVQQPHRTLDTVTLFLGERPRGLVLAVLDHAPARPAVPSADDALEPDPADLATTGRGLFIVRALARDVWVEPLRPGPGKWVCAALRT
ncbi:ATP-binding protein [Thermomonospora cellulosilytica]|uniref:Anti-sigma regulatory factor (Ser/Thr protein kinase) n=1 Tax=Thermomonospora cellulosilytica TaxID=1411118 RepID=A0A7W3MVG6_9ACTN|nr:ATP-binding protein [Thermomonospora cellulosilytica]MBA9002651.1 anti-sigma regulatory factor (Ser/Thr protein kinase) [Thermomonospora cellulosilytica]